MRYTHFILSAPAAKGGENEASYHEKAEVPGTARGGEYVVRYVFRRGEPDLSGVHGPAGRPERLGGHSGLSGHRGGPAPVGGGGPGHQPGRRPVGAEQPGGPEIRPLLHLPALSDHWPLLRHSPVRHRLLYGGVAAAAARGQREPGFGGVLGGVLRGGPLFLPAAGRDPDLDRQGAEPAVSGLPGGAFGPGPDRAPGGDRPDRPHRGLRRRRFCHRSAGGVQHHGRPGRAGLRDHRCGRHPAAGGH